MTKYRLSYYDNGVINSIDLSKLEFFKDKDVTDIKYIDEFTMQFSNVNELLLFLKKDNIVDSNIKKLFITKDKKDKDTKVIYKERIFNGDTLLFKNNSVCLHMTYIYKYLIDNLENGEVIENIIDNYYKKYFSRGSGPKYIESVLLSLKGLARYVKKSGYNSLPNSEINEYIKNIEKFMIFEFYKYDYIPYSGEFVKLSDTNGNSIRNYINIRNFVVNIILKNKNIVKDNEIKISKSEILEDDHEEFLTYEDFEMSDKQVLDNYEPDDNKNLYKDREYYKPLTKRELKMEYKNIADELVNKGNKRR